MLIVSYIISKWLDLYELITFLWKFDKNILEKKNNIQIIYNEIAIKSTTISHASSIINVRLQQIKTAKPSQVKSMSFIKLIRRTLYAQCNNHALSNSMYHF